MLLLYLETQYPLELQQFGQRKISFCFYPHLYLHIGEKVNVLFRVHPLRREVKYYVKQIRKVNIGTESLLHLNKVFVLCELPEYTLRQLR